MMSGDSRDPDCVATVIDESSARTMPCPATDSSCRTAVLEGRRPPHRGHCRLLGEHGLSVAPRARGWQLVRSFGVPRWPAQAVGRSLPAVSTQPSNEPAPNETPVSQRGRRSDEIDRRALTLRTLVTSGLAPRRRGGRRAGEHESPVDFHEPYLLRLAIALLVLSVADGFLTVKLLSGGAEEANPVLAFVLDEHPRLFAAVKMGLTGLGSCCSSRWRGLGSSSSFGRARF